MLTSDFTRSEVTRAGSWLISIEGRPASERMAKLRIPPAWTDVRVDPDPSAVVVAVGKDRAGRLQRLYSPEHVASARAGKFERVRALLAELPDIRTQIEEDLNDRRTPPKVREAATVAYLILETGVRPGSVDSADGLCSQDGTETYGATTLELRHVKPKLKCVVLAFTGKKGVAQRIRVTNPWLVKELVRRKAASNRWSMRLFDCSAGALRNYVAGLGSGGYHPKDLRTALGTKVALELLGGRKRIPKAASKRRRIVNAALDRVARTLGNTRTVSRSAYVDPSVLERFLDPLPKPKYDITVTPLGG